MWRINCRSGHPLCMTSLLSVLSFILTILFWSLVRLQVRDATLTRRRLTVTEAVIGATSPEVFSSRRRRYETVCENMQDIPGQVQSVYVHETTGVIYCHVPKAGCTFWKRVFNFVNNKVNEELKIIVEYFFDITYSNEETKEFLKNCITPHELAFRMWQNFVWRGYIHPNVSYHPPDPRRGPGLVKADLLAQLEVARARGLEDPSSMSRAKQAFYTNAFSSLSPHTLETLVRKFKYDYALFLDP
ncbi:carbohydrate sulfotransferase [Elysia marginata]|uniref:Carbohydrate sulfotransferase n=1 Tax=Elysia marginata TaxID=1093978 RepID=A0AAV4H9F4_9GAST|nr:carbohydrate sulfotransferase [Elysia marginata]